MTAQQQMSPEQQVALANGMVAALELQRNAALNDAARLKAIADENARVGQELLKQLNAANATIEQQRAEIEALRNPAA